MYEKDYIMRIIKEMVRAILKLTFDIDTESPTAELLEDTKQEEVYNELLLRVDKGDINEAENMLFEQIEGGNMDKLKMALLFYSYLNGLSDDFLDDNDFSREEVEEGLKSVMKMYGLEAISDIY